MGDPAVEPGGDRPPAVQPHPHQLQASQDRPGLVLLSPEKKLMIFSLF